MICSIQKYCPFVSHEGEVGVSVEFRKCKLEAVPFGPFGSVCRRRCEVFSA